MKQIDSQLMMRNYEEKLQEVVPGARLIVLGKQGAGKGTQCMRLSRRHDVLPHISTEDMLRAAVMPRTPLGLEARRYLDVGDLIPSTRSCWR